MEDCSGENNRTLPNALRDKCSSQRQQIDASSGANFTIPALKTAPSSADGVNLNNSSPGVSKLNQFLLAQLQERNKSGELPAHGSLVLPPLQLGRAKDTIETFNKGPFQVPLLFSQKPLDPCLPPGQLEAQDPQGKKSIIDLSAALAGISVTTPTAKQRPSGVPSKNEAASFRIPFIECDRREVIEDDYCTIDIGNCAYQHSLAKPSSMGRVFALKYQGTTDLPLIDHAFYIRHKVEAFQFDTSSPDDIVSANLKRKLQRKT